jgi:hypothetical protein
MNKLLLLSLLGIATLRSAGAWTLPAANQPPANSWTPGVGCGVIGGIPTSYTQSGATISATGSDETATINTALSNASNSTFVLLGPGTHICNGMITIPYNKQVILRGSGMNTTTIASHAAGSTGLSMGTGSDYNWAWPTSGNNVTAGLTKGSTQITLSDTSAFSVGQIIRIATANDPALPVVSALGYGSVRTQKARVTSKDSTHLNIFPAIYGDFSGGGNGSVNVAQLQANNSGLENLTLDLSNTTVIFGIMLEQCYNCWINNVHILKSSNYQIYLWDCLNCEIRHCFVDTVNGSGSNHAGIEPASSCACLIEDNIVYHAFPMLEMWNGGNAGNVVAFNYFLDAEGGGAINTNHNTHNCFNLYEGNVAPNIEADGYFGSVSHDTVYKNWFTAIDGGQTYALTLKRWTRNYVVAGNIFQSPGYTWADSGVSFGQPNMGNSSSTGTAQYSLGAGHSWNDLTAVTATTPYAGTLTTRTSDDAGIITLSSGTFDNNGKSGDGIQMIVLWAGGSCKTNRGTPSGGTVPVSGTSTVWGNALPPLNTAVTIWAGPTGFQELDLDVQATTTFKGNYYFFNTGIPASEAMGSDTLPASLFRSAKPAWFGNLTWPAFDSTNVGKPAATAIPAGYRYVNGIDPPAGSILPPSNAKTSISSP